MHPSPEFHVLVLGAGSTGLALSHALSKSSIPHTLFERDSRTTYTTRPRDWGFLLHWGAPYLQKCLPEELWYRRTEMYVDPWHDYRSSSASLVWNGATGEEIVRPKGESSGEGTVRLSRRKVREVLSERLDIQYSKRLEDITFDTDKVTAHFDDGTSVTGSLLIGCDGGRSKVREYIVGASAARGFDTDYTMINTWTTVPRSTALGLRAKHPIISMAMQPVSGASVLIAILDKPRPDDERAEDWKFQIYTGWAGAPRKADLTDAKTTMEFWRSRFQGMMEPMFSAGMAVKEDTVLPVDEGWNFKPMGEFEWDNRGGRITLAGDAAHAMLPHRGQGLNNAMMDAGMLADAVGKVFRGEMSLRDAIGEYEDEMRPRGSNEVELTLETMRTSVVRAMDRSPLQNLGFQRPKAQEPVSKLSYTNSTWLFWHVHAG